jgi:hypothetical protein
VGGTANCTTYSTGGTANRTAHGARRATDPVGTKAQTTRIGSVEGTVVDVSEGLRGQRGQGVPRQELSCRWVIEASAKTLAEEGAYHAISTVSDLEKREAEAGVAVERLHELMLATFRKAERPLPRRWWKR